MTLSRRCLGVVALVSTLHAWGLTWLDAQLGRPTRSVLPIALACICALTLAAAAWWLRPLRRDLEKLQVLARPDADVEAAASTAAYAETQTLLRGLSLLLARARELTEIEQSARRASEQAERLRVSFVAAMGHDLRGPLNSVIGFADLLVMAGQDEVAEAQRGSVELIRRAARDLIVLLEQILDWAKLEAGQIALARSEVDPVAVIDDAVNQGIKRSGARGLRVEKELPEPLPKVFVDARRLTQALLGLMDHATRAADQPTLALRARVAAPGRLGKGTGEGAGLALRIELTDPQLSVREADQGLFFEAFRPSYAPSGRRVGGLALGPALARALVRAHGGQVWFDSRPEGGTTFTIELPLSAPQGA